MPPQRQARTIGSVEFVPDQFFQEWTPSKPITNHLDLRSSVIDAFNLSKNDQYVYHAIASVTLSQVQEAIDHGGKHGLHAWYIGDDGELLPPPPQSDIDAYTSIFSSTTSTSKALTGLAANAKKGSHRASIAVYLQSKRHLPSTYTIPKLKKEHTNPYYDYWCWSCKDLEWAGPEPGTTNVRTSHHILPIFMHHFGCVVPSYEGLEVVKQSAKGKPVLEIGSGNGYWAYVLRRLGLTVTAVDNFQSEYRTLWISDTIIQDGEKYLKSKDGAKEAILLLVYPVVGLGFTSQIMQAYKGTTICVAGTQNRNGYTAFQDRIIDEYVTAEKPDFAKTVQIPLPSFAGKDEALFKAQATMAKSSNACPLLSAPLEIRHQIIGEVLFPGETQPKDLTQNNRGTASTAVRQIHPYDIDEDKKPCIDVAIIRTCSQLQHEAEAVLYGSSSWNLMYQDWWDRDKVSYDFFERLPRRLRRLIQRVERKCYSEPYWNTIGLFDWKLFMSFLAQECPNLHSLRLWGPGDRQEGPQWVETCGKDQEWVQAILQIKSLQYFDVPVIPGGVIYEFPKFQDDFMPWLKFNLIGDRKGVNAEDTVTSNSQTGPFRFLQLERNIRDLIYSHALLPADKRVHPYIKSWYDLTTRAVVPVFLTCKQMHHEAEAILYGQGIFTSPPLQKYEKRLCRWLGGRLREPGTGLNPRLLALIKHLSFGWHKVGQHRFFSIITRSMQLEQLELILSANDVEYINGEWLHRAMNPKALWRAGYSGDFAMVSNPICRYKYVLLFFFHITVLQKDVLFVSSKSSEDLSLGMLSCLVIHQHEHAATAWDNHRFYSYPC
ncbi:MAG: hypothetical protein Q9191_006440 [Dirinaria sp. TL-2023a]